jgi:hypothetical protein
MDSPVSVTVSVGVRCLDVWRAEWRRLTAHSLRAAADIIEVGQRESVETMYLSDGRAIVWIVIR